MDNLTLEEFDLIMEGLDNLPNKGVAGEIMGSLMTHMLAKDDDQRKELQKKEEKMRKEKEEAHKNLAERLILLKAKLIYMKDQIMADNLVKN